MNKKIIYPVIYLLLVIFMIVILPEIVDTYIWDQNELVWENVERMNLAYAIFGLIIPLYLAVISTQLYSKYPIFMIYALFLVVIGLFSIADRFFTLGNEITSVFYFPIVLIYIRSLGSFGILLAMVLSQRFDQKVRYAFLIFLVVNVLQTVLFGRLSITILTRLNLIEQVYQMMPIASNVFNLFSTVAMCFVIYSLFKEEESQLQTTEVFE